MATIKDITNALYDELTPVVANVVGCTLTEARTRVDLYNRWDEQTHPFIGIERFGPLPLPSGIGNEAVVVEAITDQNDVVTDIRKRRRRRLRCDVTPLDGRDDASGADDLYIAVDDRLTQLADGPATEFHADVTDISIVDMTPESRPSEGVRGRTIVLHVDYDRLYTQSVDAMETVDLGFTKLDKGTEYEQSGQF